MAILGFADKETARVFKRQFSRKLPQDIQRVALQKVIYLNHAQTLSDLRGRIAGAQKVDGEWYMPSSSVSAMAKKIGDTK